MPCVILCDMLIKIRNIELNNRCSFPIFLLFTVYRSMMHLQFTDIVIIYEHSYNELNICHNYFTMYRYDIRVIY